MKFHAFLATMLLCASPALASGANVSVPSLPASLPGSAIAVILSSDLDEIRSQVYVNYILLNQLWSWVLQKDPGAKIFLNEDLLVSSVVLQKEIPESQREETVRRLKVVLSLLEEGTPEKEAPSEE